MRVFAFRCEVCNHRDDVWLDEPDDNLTCPSCAAPEFRRVWGFTNTRSNQECPPGTR